MEMTDSMSLNNNNTVERREFLKLFMDSQKSIYAYILSMVHNRSDAEDLVQEAALLMWDKFDEFEAGTNFTAWGIRISRYLILNYYKSQKDIKHFDEDLLNDISACYQRKVSEVKSRLDALEECLGKLNRKDRELIRVHYEKGFKITEAKDVFGSSVHVLYRAMARIHDLLHRCVNRTIRAWETYG